MITRRQPNKGDMEVQLDAIDLLAKNYYDDLRYLQKFNVYIISPKDALKLSTRTALSFVTLPPNLYLVA